MDISIRPVRLYELRMNRNRPRTVGSVTGFPVFAFRTPAEGSSRRSQPVAVGVDRVDRDVQELCDLRIVGDAEPDDG